MESSLNFTTYFISKQTSIDTSNCNNPLYLIRSPWLEVRIQYQLYGKNYNNSVKLNITQLNHRWVKEEIKTEIKDFLGFNENKSTT